MAYHVHVYHENLRELYKFDRRKSRFRGEIMAGIQMIFTESGTEIFHVVDKHGRLAIRSLYTFQIHVVTRL